MNPSTALSDAQTKRYWRDGYLAGIPVLSPEQMTIARQALAQLEGREIEEDSTRWIQPDYQPWTHHDSPWWHWFQGLVRHPAIIGAVTSLLGPNVLLRNADIFVKPVKSSKGINWHTDTTAGGGDADKMLTAWLAISPSTPRNGCMEWLVGSHRKPLPDEVADKHSLTFGIDSSKTAANACRDYNLLEAGELSLHHFRTVHRSLHNRTSRPRTGLVMRFMASDTPKEVAESGKGTLVAGQNVPGHFRLETTFPVSWDRTERAQVTPPRRWWHWSQPKP